MRFLSTENALLVCRILASELPSPILMSEESPLKSALAQPETIFFSTVQIFEDLLKHKRTRPSVLLDLIKSLIDGDKSEKTVVACCGASLLSTSRDVKFSESVVDLILTVEQIPQSLSYLSKSSSSIIETEGERCIKAICDSNDFDSVGMALQMLVPVLVNEQLKKLHDQILSSIHRVLINGTGQGAQSIMKLLPFLCSSQLLMGNNEVVQHMQSILPLVIVLQYSVDREFGSIALHAIAKRLAIPNIRTNFSGYYEFLDYTAQIIGQNCQNLNDLISNIKSCLKHSNPAARSSSVYFLSQMMKSAKSMDNDMKSSILDSFGKMMDDQSSEVHLSVLKSISSLSE